MNDPVVIVGAGPVGLFLGCCLALRGIPFSLLEARSERLEHSRAIGVHPPALERFERLGLAGAMLERGVKIERGHAFANTRLLGTLHFASCPPPYPFILSLPQHETEGLLSARLEALAPGCLEPGVRLVGLEEDRDGVTLRLEGSETRRASFVVGCDGKESRVRRAAGFAFSGGPYPDAYLMGDFADHTDLGPDAAIYLCDDGLIESFPLPQGKRRWVVKTDGLVETPSPARLSTLIEERLGNAPDPETNTMLSAFGVQRFLARPIARGRILLAGDAAHVLSPIGGQGMNLGWLGAWDAAEALETCLEQPERRAALVEGYALERRGAARRATLRSAFNTALGRRTAAAGLKYGVVRLALAGPLEPLFARLFTMRWL